MLMNNRTPTFFSVNFFQSKEEQKEKKKEYLDLQVFHQ